MRNTFGAFLQLMEFETAFMGELLEINAFDQEGVELGKKFTFGLMGRKGYEEYRTQFDAYEKERGPRRRVVPRRRAMAGALSAQFAANGLRRCPRVRTRFA